MLNLKDRPFALVGVNVNDYESKDLKQRMERANLPWRSLKYRADVVRRWNPATPTFYTIDHRGAIRHKWVGGVGAARMDAALEPLMREAEHRRPGPGGSGDPAPLGVRYGAPAP